MDAALVDGLAGDAGRGVEVVVAKRVGVSVGDPGHLPFAGAHVGRRHVDAGTEESLLGEFDGEAPRDPLQLAVRVQLGIDAHARLAAAKRHVDTRALVGHERGQGLHLVPVDVGGEPDSALAGRPVVRVLRPVPHDHLVAAVILLHGEVDLEHVGARLHAPEDAVHLLPLVFLGDVPHPAQGVHEVILAQNARLSIRGAHTFKISVRHKLERIMNVCGYKSNGQVLCKYTNAF